jgi:uncharacterized protein YaaN involved in tellurite resistance
MTEPAATPANAESTPTAPAVTLAQVGADLDPELRQRVDAQVEAFMQALAQADVRSDDFRRRLDAAFRLGRKEIAEATRLNTAFMRDSYRGLESSPGYRAMAELRQVLDELNPGRQGDLMAPVKWFGLIPGGTRLKAYLRKFESCGDQIDALLLQLAAAQDDLERDAAALEETRAQMLEALRNLAAAAHFARALQRRLKAQVEALKLADPARARALEQEALFYATQNLDGVLAQQAVTLNGVLAIEPLKKSARELSIGLDRLKTTGMAALAVAQTIAVATGRQARVQQAMARTREVIGDLVVQGSQQLGQHVQTVGRFAADPILDVQKLQAAFDNSFKALDALDALRAAAIETMEKNNAALSQLVARAEQQVARSERALPDAALAGPVALG